MTDRLAERLREIAALGALVHIHDWREIQEACSEGADRIDTMKADYNSLLIDYGEERSACGFAVAGAGANLKRAEAAEAGGKKLREALEKYGDHSRGCLVHSERGPCNCGLASALAETEKADDPR